jgi:hypothetical protein
MFSRMFCSKKFGISGIAVKRLLSKSFFPLKRRFSDASLHPFGDNISTPDGSCLEFYKMYQWIYVDKTAIIQELIENCRAVVITRPRRFGKTLLLDTIQCIAEKQIELLSRLYIGPSMEERKKHPVFRVDFSSHDYAISAILDSLIILFEANGIESDNLIQAKNELEKNYEDTNLYTTVLDYFKDALKIFSSGKYKNKVLEPLFILLDEHDDPLRNPNPKIAKLNSDVMNQFYKIVKANQDSYRFMLVTGILHFHHTGLSTGTNFIDDLSDTEICAPLIEITEAELKKYFDKYVENQVTKLMTKDNIYKYMKNQFYGYKFSTVVNILL